MDLRVFRGPAPDVVDGEVRELIRRRGLDPFTDPAPVRVLVRDVVADYSGRSLNSALPPIGDAESVVRDAARRLSVARRHPDVTRRHMTVIARRVRRADVHRCV